MAFPEHYELFDSLVFRNVLEERDKYLGRNHTSPNEVLRQSANRADVHAATEILHKLEKVTRAPSIDTGLGDLRHAILQFVPDFHNEPQHTRRIVTVSGEPYAGKSLLIDLLMGAMEMQAAPRLPTDAQGYLQVPTFSPDLKIKKTHLARYWEDAEEAARAKGFVTTDRKEKFKAKELLDSNFMLELAVRRALIESLVTFVEDPAVPADIRDPSGRVMIERTVGDPLIRHVYTNTGTFRLAPPIGTHTYNATLGSVMYVPEYQPYAIVLIAGNVLREVAGPARQLFKNAVDFQLAKDIAQTFRLPVPDDPEHMKQLQAQGASLKQMFNNEHEVDEHIKALEANKQLEPVKMSDALVVFEEQVEPYTSQIGLPEHSMLRRVQRALRLGRYFQLRFKLLNIEPTHYFIGFNNPTFSDLGIEDTEKMKYYLRQVRVG